MTVRDFRELRVYKAGFRAAMRIFRLSRRWPDEERYSLTSQIRRSSRSVCANIGEAWRKRRYPAHFASKLSDSDTEAGETLVWLEFAKQCGYLAPKAFESLTETYEHINAQLVTMMNNSNRWCL